MFVTIGERKQEGTKEIQGGTAISKKSFMYLPCACSTSIFHLNPIQYSIRVYIMLLEIKYGKDCNCTGTC